MGERKRENGPEGRTKVESNIRKLIQLSGQKGVMRGVVEYGCFV